MRALHPGNESQLASSSPSGVREPKHDIRRDEVYDGKESVGTIGL